MFARLFAQVLGNHDLPVKCVEHNTATGLVVSGGWDSTLRLWDARAADGSGRQVGKLPLPGRVYAMASSNKRLVIATADKRIQIYDLRSLRAGAAPMQQRESPLKYQIRTLRCTPDERGYAASSVEGRVALDYFDDAQSAATKFAFKCHRRTEGGKELVYPVNALGASRPSAAAARPMPRAHALAPCSVPPRARHVRHWRLRRLRQHLGRRREETPVCAAQVPVLHRRAVVQPRWNTAGAIAGAW